MLDERLRCVASMVRRGSRVADIGTDHAYLPVALVQSGHCPAAIASDIRKGPTDAARRSVSRAGLTEQIDIRLGSGLSTVAPDEVEDIVIAGMGGETIVSVLSDAPWIKDAQYHLIIQPMTRAEILRRYLWEQGFSIDRECVVSQGRHCYTVMSVNYTGTPCMMEPALWYIGRILPQEGDRYLNRVCERLKKQQQAKPNEQRATCLRRIEQYRNGSWMPWKE